MFAGATTTKQLVVTTDSKLKKIVTQFRDAPLDEQPHCVTNRDVQSERLCGHLTNEWLNAQDKLLWNHSHLTKATTKKQKVTLRTGRAWFYSHSAIYRVEEKKLHT